MEGDILPAEEGGAIIDLREGDILLAQTHQKTMNILTIEERDEKSGNLPAQGNGATTNELNEDGIPPAQEVEANIAEFEEGGNIPEQGIDTISNVLGQATLVETPTATALDTTVMAGFGRVVKLEHNLTVGDKVEACTEEEGLKGAWWKGSIEQIVNSRALICFDDLLDDNGVENLKEWYPSNPPWTISFSPSGEVLDEVEADQVEGVITLSRKVRPISPIESFEVVGKKRKRVKNNTPKLTRGDQIEAHIDDAWWEAIVTSTNGKGVNVYYPGEDERGTIQFSTARQSLTFQEGFWQINTQKGVIPSKSKLESPSTEKSEVELGHSRKKAVGSPGKKSANRKQSGKGKVARSTNKESAMIQWSSEGKEGTLETIVVKSKKSKAAAAVKTRSKNVPAKKPRGEVQEGRDMKPLSVSGQRKRKLATKAEKEAPLPSTDIPKPSHRRSKVAKDSSKPTVQTPPNQIISVSVAGASKTTVFVNLAGADEEHPAKRLKLRRKGLVTKEPEAISPSQASVSRKGKTTVQEETPGESRAKTARTTRSKGPAPAPSEAVKQALAEIKSASAESPAAKSKVKRTRKGKAAATARGSAIRPKRA